MKYSDGLAPYHARIKTGQYTGDGSTSQAITGIGFQPKFLHIITHETVAWTNVNRHLRDENSAISYVLDGVTGHSATGLGEFIESLDADGFTVDDAGIDAHPNKNLQVYDFVAYG